MYVGMYVFNLSYFFLDFTQFMKHGFKRLCLASSCRVLDTSGQ